MAVAAVPKTVKCDELVNKERRFDMLHLFNSWFLSSPLTTTLLIPVSPCLLSLPPHPPPTEPRTRRVSRGSVPSPPFHAPQRAPWGSHSPIPTDTSSCVQLSTYPAVASSLETINSLIASNAVTASLLARSTALSQAVLAHLAPVLPLAQVDGLANQGLDILEKQFPIVKTPTETLVQKVRGPAEDAVGVARAYAGGVQSVSTIYRSFGSSGGCRGHGREG